MGIRLAQLAHTQSCFYDNKWVFFLINSISLMATNVNTEQESLTSRSHKKTTLGFFVLFFKLFYGNTFQSSLIQWNVLGHLPYFEGDLVRKPILCCGPLPASNLNNCSETLRQKTTTSIMFFTHTHKRWADPSSSCLTTYMYCTKYLLIYHLS